MAAVPGMVPRNPNRPREGNSAKERQGFQDRLGKSRGPNPDPQKPYPGGQGSGAPNKGPARPGQPKPIPPAPKKNSPGPGATGTGGGRDTPGAGKDRGQFEKDRQRERGTGKDRPPIYKPKPSLSPAGRSLKGSSVVHGMLPIA